MKLTDDIVRAIHACVEDSFESVADFANFANISSNSISKYMRKEITTINKTTWDKLYPLIRNYMPKKDGGGKLNYDLDADQKILLDAFNALPKDVQNQKLLEIVELAKQQVRREHGDVGVE